MNIGKIEEKVEAIKKILDPERAKRERAKERAKGVAKGLAIGSFIGGLAGIFFAPDKGENTRRRAKKELEKAKDILENNMVEGKQKFEGFMEEHKETINDKLMTVKDKFKCKCNAEATEEDKPEEKVD
ncbi:YtxH domain-containing protein [Alkaliphilus pronyensis]|uniref:YtxH domain-containing protein n=1 Tax=Alkaliphilus pronyensis TaxID=1482732 RepID=A0A6I0EYL5_9FIRM|nr:YtxH domain-containing protein [Alkaliphilus pronyensis]KAB3530492.1 YtxH domain-containing protein [Alkaliphilus pronyensis]